MKFINVVIIILLLIVAVLIYAGVRHAKLQDAARMVCESQGGVYFTPNGGHICLRKEAVIWL